MVPVRIRALFLTEYAALKAFVMIESVTYFAVVARVTEVFPAAVTSLRFSHKKTPIKREGRGLFT